MTRKNKKWAINAFIVGILTGSLLVAAWALGWFDDERQAKMAEVTFDTEKLDAYFDALEANDKFMGSVAVTRNGKVVYQKSVGYADIEKGVKADKETRYGIGSISKTLTAAMVMMAVEEGRLNLEQRLSEFYPTLPNAEEISIAHLLAHRSGLDNYTQGCFEEWSGDYKSSDELLAMIAGGGVLFEPDAKAAYSNSNYLLLSYILEKVYGDSFGDLLNEMIVEPLGLKHTTFGIKPEVKESFANSYKYWDEWLAQLPTLTTNSMGAGGVMSTASDVAQFADALFSGELISEASLAKMMTMQDNFGMGLFVVPFGEMRGYGHTGGIDGFQSVFVYFPESGVSYCAVSNGVDYLMNDVSIAVLSAVFGREYEVPVFVKSDEVADANVVMGYEGEYSSAQLPIKLKVINNNGKLMAQGTGQAAFPLSLVSGNVYEFKQAGIVIEFKVEENALILKQGGGVFMMKK